SIRYSTWSWRSEAATASARASALPLSPSRWGIFFNLFFNFILKITHPDIYICRSNPFGRAGLHGVTKTRCRATCIGVTRCATSARFGALGRGLPAHIPRVKLFIELLLFSPYYFIYQTLYRT